MVMQAISSVMLLGYNSILSKSAAAVAVLGVYVKLQSFVFMPLFGLNQGVMPIVGYNYGARNRERMMEAYRKALITAIIIMMFGLALFQTMPGELLKMFSADAEMLKVGVPALRIISLCFVPAAFDVISSAMFQSTGHGGGATVHYVDEGVDTGKIILQREVPVLKDDTPESLQERVLEIEHKILPEAIFMLEKAFTEGRD